MRFFLFCETGGVRVENGVKTIFCFVNAYRFCKALKMLASFYLWWFMST